MTLFELQKNIKQQNLPNFLIFTGTEYAIIELYLDMIAKRGNLEKISLSTASQIVQKQKIVSIIKSNCLYVCRYDFDFLKKEKDWSYINKSVGNNILILVYTNLDKRGKFYKQFENNIVDFGEQSEDTIKLMLKPKTTLSNESLNRLILGCGKNYSKCILEIDKINILSNIKNITHEQAYNILLKDGTIHEELESKLPEFTNAVLMKNLQCYQLYNALQKSGESNIVILSWLYNAVRNQLSVQTVQKANTESTGLNYFFIKECLDRKGYYTVSELLNFLKIIKFCEQGLKNGLLEESILIDYILVNVL